MMLIFTSTLKSDPHIPIFFLISFNDSPSKIMKNVFMSYVILKALFVLKYLNFSLDILNMQKKRPE